MKVNNTHFDRDNQIKKVLSKANDYIGLFAKASIY